MLPQTRTRPFHKSREHRRALRRIQQKLGDKMGKVHVCTYAAPFGVTPQELDEVYPLSQYEIAVPFDDETTEYTAKQVSNYIETTDYKRVVLLQDAKVWKGKIATACRRACKKKKISPAVLSVEKPWNKRTLNDLATAIQNVLS